MGKTSIQWTDRSLNPIRARKKVEDDAATMCYKITEDRAADVNEDQP